MSAPHAGSGCRYGARSARGAGATRGDSAPDRTTRGDSALDRTTRGAGAARGAGALDRTTRGAGAARSAALALALVVAPARASAQEGGAAWGRRSTASVEPSVTPTSEPAADGVYGRFSGDLDFGLGAGVEVDRDALRGAARLDVHYFSMAGVYVTGSDALGREVDGARRVFALGVDVRPGFVPRWAKNMQQGPAFADLFLDSIALGLGAFWSAPGRNASGGRRGFEASLGFGLPLLGRAPGPWLESRGMLRWPDAADGQDGRAVPGVVVLLAWHAFVVSPLAHDPSPL